LSPDSETAQWFGISAQAVRLKFCAMKNLLGQNSNLLLSSTRTRSLVSISDNWTDLPHLGKVSIYFYTVLEFSGARTYYQIKIYPLSLKQRGYSYGGSGLMPGPFHALVFDSATHDAVTQGGPTPAKFFVNGFLFPSVAGLIPPSRVVTRLSRAVGDYSNANEIYKSI
jgi:hypothetical protein